MTSYKATQVIPSCNVTKPLLEDLEGYIVRKAGDITGQEPDELKRHYGIVIQDSRGEEGLNSMSEYRRNQFPDDIRRVRLGFASYGEPSVRIWVSFGLDKASSEVGVQITAPNAKELALVVIGEIGYILKEYRNVNFIFSDRYEYLSICVLSGTFVYGFMSAINLLFKQRVPDLFDAAFYLLFLASFIYFVLRRFNRYSMFDTRKNGSATKTIRWILSGVGGVLVFGVLAMYLRKFVFNI